MKVQKFLTDDDEYGDEESDAAVTFADHPGPHQGGCAGVRCLCGHREAVEKSPIDPCHPSPNTTNQQLS